MSSKESADTADILDEPYNSEDDEDFNPTTTNANESATDSEEDGDEGKSKQNPAEKSSITTAVIPAGDGDSDIDSGDETVINRGKRKRSQRKDNNDDDYNDDDDEGGEGGLIKTRAQRAKENETKQKVPRSSAASSTLDVDALWKSMNSHSGPSTSTSATKTTPSQNVSQNKTLPVPKPYESLPNETAKMNEPSTTNQPPKVSEESKSETPVPEGMVRIKRTYKFAGDVISEEKDVPEDSFEAKAYLSSLSTQPLSKSQATEIKKPLRRPTKRTSMFDPANSAKAKTTKLTTLEKSRLDWAGYVDKEGLGDELDKQRKGGSGYLDRQDFLDRVANRTGTGGR